MDVFGGGYVMSEINSLIGNNLRIERESVGMSRTSMANALNIKRTVLDEYEAGNLEFEEDFLELVADVLRCSVSVFFKEHVPLNNARFRSKKPLNSCEAILNTCSEHLQDFLCLEEFLQKKTTSDLAIIREKCFSADIAQYALTVRQYLGLSSTEPVVDVCEIAERCGVKLVPFNCQEVTVSGLSALDDETGPVLFLNTNPKLSVEHKRFSFAHELGHLLIHTGDYRNECNSEESTHEKEANAFASNFLMPEEGFVTGIRNTRGLPIYSVVLRIKNNFGISCTSVLYRMNQHYGRQFDSAFAIAFKRETGKAFLRTEEPFPMSEADFGTQKIKAMVRDAIEKDLITVSRGAEILKCSVSEMRRVMSEWV